MDNVMREEPRVVSRAQWSEEREVLLRKEKELTRASDALAAERRALPWVRVDERYVFEGGNGRETLSDLFRGRSQLIVYHFMFGPGWGEGCVGCSFTSDQTEGALVHLERHDVKYVAVSQAPYAELAAFKKRMGWSFDWVSSHGSGFNYDFGATVRKAEGPDEQVSGSSVFVKDAAGALFHTYSSWGRGGEKILGAYMLLDLTPRGRNENGPNFNLTDWVRHHDRYESGGYVDATGRYRATPRHDATCCHVEAESAGSSSTLS